MFFQERHRLPHGPQTPALAREVVDEALRDRLDRERLADVRLLVSEIATNAVRHGLDREGAVELALEYDGTRVRVEVADGGDGFLPSGRRADPDEVGGWGLIVVEQLAERWGIDVGDGTRVWFELDHVPGASGGGRATMTAAVRNV